MTADFYIDKNYFEQPLQSQIHNQFGSGNSSSTFGTVNWDFVSGGGEGVNAFVAGGVDWGFTDCIVFSPDSIPTKIGFRSVTIDWCCCCCCCCTGWCISCCCWWLTCGVIWIIKFIFKTRTDSTSFTFSHSFAITSFKYKSKASILSKILV